MKPIYALPAILLVTVFFYGCVPSRSLHYQTESADQRLSLRRIVRTWTRSGQVINRFVTVLDASATYWSPELRIRYTRQIVEDRQLNPLEGERFRQQQLQQAKEYQKFLVAVYTWDEEWQDFDRDEPTWTIWFENDQGVQVHAWKVTEMELDRAEAWQYLRIDTPWSKLYEVLFPLEFQGQPLLDAETEQFKLCFASVLGHLDLSWNLVPENRKTEN